MYPFQAAGEFTLLKSTQDNLQIQARQQPIPGSLTVAENTAIAMRVGSATVEVNSVHGTAIAVYKAALPATRPTATQSKLSPIELGPGSGQPEAAYDPASGDTYVAWVDDSDDWIDLCVVIPAAQSCNGGAGPYHLVDALASAGGYTPIYSDVQLVLQPGGNVAVLAEADGASPGVYPSGYGAEGVVAWSSPAGGAAFAAADQGIDYGGVLLAPSAGDAPSGGAVALDAGDIGVFGDSALGNDFTDFGLGASAPAGAPVADNSGDFPDPLGNTGSQLASIPDPAAPGEYVVVAVGADFHTPAACPAGTADATGYGVGIGTPGQLQTQSAWSSTYFEPVSCEADDPVLAGGGPAGGTIGLLEEEGPMLTASDSGAEGIYYRRFDPGTDSFDAPVLVSNEATRTVQSPNDIDVSQDSSGGVYGTWSDSRGLVVTYSATGGASWSTPLPVTLPATPDDDVVITGTGRGGAELAYTAEPGGSASEYLVALSYSQLKAG
jgi:hypothetical protein